MGYTGGVAQTGTPGVLADGSVTHRRRAPLEPAGKRAGLELTPHVRFEPRTGV